jgi:NDP-sugar pyrophosphorylase family protein
MLDLTCLILCGGKGERLRPLTSTQQKCLLSVQGRPFLEYIVDQIKSFDLDKIIFCCGYRGYDIINYFSQGPIYQPFEFSYPDRFINTGARALKALELVDTKYIIVFNGDSYCNINKNQLVEIYQNFIKNKDNAVKLLVSKEGSLLSSFISSPIKGYYGAGIYFFKRTFLRGYEYNDNLSIEDHMINRINCNYIVLPEMCYTIDIGTVENYQEVNNEKGRFGRIFAHLNKESTSKKS